MRRVEIGLSIRAERESARSDNNARVHLTGFDPIPDGAQFGDAALVIVQVDFPDDLGRFLEALDGIGGHGASF